MRVLFALGLLAVLVRPAAAQQPAAPADTSSLDLAALLAEIRSANPSLRAARLEADAVGQRRRQAEALPDPTVSVAVMPFPMLTAHGAQRSQWSAEQMIPYPGKRALQGTVAGWEAEVAARRAEVLAEDLLFEAKRAYYELYRTQQLQALIAAFQAELQGFEEVAAVRYEVGQGSQQAILKAQLERNQLAQQLLALRVERRRAAEMLAHLTGHTGGTRFFLTVQVAPPPTPAFAPDVLAHVAARERAAMALLDAETALAEAQIDLAEKQFRPDFGVSLSYFDIAARDVPATATGTDALAVGASVKVPLRRGPLRAAVEEARLGRAAVEARREALHLEIETEIETLVFALGQEADILDLYEQALLPQARTTAEATLSAYSNGRTDFLDLLDAERSLFALLLAQEDARARYLTTAAALERALGLDDLAALDALVRATPDSDR